LIHHYSSTSKSYDMTTKLFFPATLSLISAAVLSAQPSTPLHFVDSDGSGVAGLVDVLGQNALTVLLGMVALMGLAWVFCIGNACAELSKKQKSARVSSLFLCLCVAAGMSIFGSSCTAAQKAQATEIQAARMAEGTRCVCHAPLDSHNYYGNSGLGSGKYSSGANRSFCRQCGQRIYSRNH
jgi:hypothetical protein